MDYIHNYPNCIVIFDTYPSEVDGVTTKSAERIRRTKQVGLGVVTKDDPKPLLKSDKKKFYFLFNGKVQEDAEVFIVSTEKDKASNAKNAVISGQYIELLF